LRRAVPPTSCRRQLRAPAPARMNCRLISSPIRRQKRFRAERKRGHGGEREGSARIDHRPRRAPRRCWARRRCGWRHFGAHRRFAPHHPERREPHKPAAGDDRAHAAGRRIRLLERPVETVGRMAHSPRDRPRPPRHRRDRALPVAFRHRAGDGAQGYPRRPFDDRAVRRSHRALRQICPGRDDGARGPDA
jgi:hypothetical protein